VGDEGIVTFLEFVRRRKGDDAPEVALAEVFAKDLRDQPELVDWYAFHSMFNKHKLFLHSLTRRNKQREGTNPNVGFLIGCNEDELDRHADATVAAAEWADRQVAFVDARGKTLREATQEICGYRPDPGHGACFHALEDVLLHQDRVVVVRELSHLRTSFRKPALARAPIKTLDDAHFSGIRPRADLIFIDYAAVLQRWWDDIGPYLDVMA